MNTFAEQLSMVDNFTKMLRDMPYRALVDYLGSTGRRGAVPVTQHTADMIRAEIIYRQKRGQNR